MPVSRILQISQSLRHSRKRGREGRLAGKLKVAPINMVEPGAIRFENQERLPKAPYYDYIFSDIFVLHKLICLQSNVISSQ